MKKAAFIILKAALAMILTGGVCSSCSNSEAGNKIEEVSKEKAVAAIKEWAAQEKNKYHLETDSLDNTVIIMTNNIPEKETGFFDDADPEAVMAICVGVIAVIMPFVFGIVAIILVLRHMRQRRLDKYRVIEHAIDHNIKLPETFYLAGIRKDTPRSAIIWMGWGLALCLFFQAANWHGMSMLALIPFFIGMARGVTYLIDRHDAKQAKKDEEKYNTPVFPDNDQPEC